MLCLFGGTKRLRASIFRDTEKSFFIYFSFPLLLSVSWPFVRKWDPGVWLIVIKEGLPQQEWPSIIFLEGEFRYMVVNAYSVLQTQGGWQLRGSSVISPPSISKCWVWRGISSPKVLVPNVGVAGKHNSKLRSRNGGAVRNPFWCAPRKDRKEGWGWVEDPPSQPFDKKSIAICTIRATWGAPFPRLSALRADCSENNDLLPGLSSSIS